MMIAEEEGKTMREFSIKEAAMSGFLLARRRPGLLIALTLFGLALSLALVGYMVATPVGAALTQMQHMRTSGVIDPALSMRLLGQIIPFMILSVLIRGIIFVVNAGAVNRAVLRPDDSRAPFIRLGGDEVRLFLLTLVIGLILLVIYLVCSLLSSIAMIAVVSASGGMQAMATNPGHLPPAAALTIYSGVALTMVVLFLIGTRFSLAPPQTVREKATRVFASFGLTKGRYWRVVGAYGLAALLLIPAVVLGAILLGVVAVITPDGLAGIMTVFRPDYSTAAGVFSPLMLTYQVVVSLLSALGSMVMLGAAAHIYAAVVDLEDEDVF